MRIVKILEQNHASLFRLDFSLGEENGNLSFFNLIVMIIMMNYVYMSVEVSKLRKKLQEIKWKPKEVFLGSFGWSIEDLGWGIKLYQNLCQEMILYDILIV